MIDIKSIQWKWKLFYVVILVRTRGFWSVYSNKVTGMCGILVLQIHGSLYVDVVQHAADIDILYYCYYNNKKKSRGKMLDGFLKKL